MSNKFRPHVYVLPEDDANRQLANGFWKHESVANREFKVLPEAGGWTKVRSQFEEEHIAEMKNNARRYLILLVDFDGKESRLEEIKKVIPPNLMERVFVIGAWQEPEDLKRDLGTTFESIGRQLASECLENRSDVWSHDLLKHNATELARMRDVLGPILFPSS